MSFAEKWMNHLKDKGAYVNQVTCTGFRPPSMPHTQIETIGDHIRQTYFGSYNGKKIPDDIGIGPAGVDVVEMESGAGITFRIEKGKRKPVFSVKPTLPAGDEVPAKDIAELESQAKELGYKVVKYKRN